MKYKIIDSIVTFFVLFQGNDAVLSSGSGLGCQCAHLREEPWRDYQGMSIILISEIASFRL